MQHDMPRANSIKHLSAYLSFADFWHYKLRENTLTLAVEGRITLATVCRIGCLLGTDKISFEADDDTNPGIIFDDIDAEAMRTLREVVYGGINSGT